MAKLGFAVKGCRASWPDRDCDPSPFMRWRPWRRRRIGAHPRPRWLGRCCCSAAALPVWPGSSCPQRWRPATSSTSSPARVAAPTSRGMGPRGWHRLAAVAAARRVPSADAGSAVAAASAPEASASARSCSPQAAVHGSALVRPECGCELLHWPQARRRTPAANARGPALSELQRASSAPVRPECGCEPLHRP